MIPSEDIPTVAQDISTLTTSKMARVAGELSVTAGRRVLLEGQRVGVSLLQQSGSRAEAELLQQGHEELVEVADIILGEVDLVEGIGESQGDGQGEYNQYSGDCHSVTFPLLPLTFLFSAFRYYRRPVVPNLSYLSLYTLRFLSANKSLFPLHLKHLLYSPPIRKQPAFPLTIIRFLSSCPTNPLWASPSGSRRRPIHTSSYNSYALRFPTPLRHLTLPCAADETSRYLIAFRVFPHKPYPLLNTPTFTPNSYLTYVLQRRFIQRPHPCNKEYGRVFRNSSVAISNRLEQADHITLRRDVVGTAARSRLTILGVLRMRQPGCYIREPITSTALIRSWEFATDTALFRSCDHSRPPQVEQLIRSWEFTTDTTLSRSWETTTGSSPRPTTLRHSQSNPSASSSFPARAIQAPLRLSPLEQSKRNLSPCAREIRAPLSCRPLEQSKRNLSPCAREIQAPLRLSPLERSKRNLSSCAREIRAPLSSRPLEQSKRSLSPCAREIQAPLRLSPLEQSKRNHSPCAREIRVLLSCRPLEQSKRNLSPCAREIRAPLSSRPLEQSKRNLSSCARRNPSGTLVLLLDSFPKLLFQNYYCSYSSSYPTWSLGCDDTEPFGFQLPFPVYPISRLSLSGSVTLRYEKSRYILKRPALKQSDDT
ncbi:hypothetical protein J6590_010970 [Homalodisca vitripennis]|nr:hypothetical protein J6590_010970 [Homalodisca vitripennis]